MITYGRSSFVKAHIIAALPFGVPIAICFLLITKTLRWYSTLEQSIDWNILQTQLLDSISVAFYLAAASALMAIPLVTIIASVSNRWFRRGRFLIHTIATIPPLLLLPLAIILFAYFRVSNFALTMGLLVLINGSWFAHYSLNRMAVSRQITWQTLQGLGATRWQTIKFIYFRQVLHHTIDLIPFLTSRILGQVLIIGILAPHWHFAPAQLWLGWTSATSPMPLGMAALEILALLAAGFLINYLAKALSTRHWERLANPNHFLMIWSEHNE